MWSFFQKEYGPQTSDQMRKAAYAYNLAWDSIFLIHG